MSYGDLKCNAALGLSITLLIFYFRFKRQNNDVPYIPGPPCKSWLYGNILEHLFHIPYGKVEEEWQNTYGRVYRTKGCFGENRLNITDSLAIRHISSRPYHFVRTDSIRIGAQLTFGHGSLFSVTGEQHNRIKGAMNPVFSAHNIRDLAPVIRRVSGDLVDKLISQCENQGMTCEVDISRHLHDMSLQAVGEAIMGYNFAADNNFKNCYENLVVLVSKRSKMAVITDAVIPRLLRWLISFIAAYFPPEYMIKSLEHHKKIENISAVVANNKLEIQNLPQTADKGLFSVLVDSNSKLGNNKMTFQELKEQFGLLNAAGEDTTGNALTWALYELAKNPDWQSVLRDEVYQADISGRLDCDKLIFLNSLIKESLRFYNTAPSIERKATEDTIIPLSTRIETTDGRKISSIRVNKGQFISVSFHAYHRLTGLWGDDANVFRPSRWHDGKSPLGVSTVGPYANLLVFWGGEYTCLGWRFAILEMQIVLCELVKKFSFSLDPGAPQVYPTAAITVAPSDGQGNFKLNVRVTA